MANWCENEITFMGDKKYISELETKIDKLIANSDGYNGVLPENFNEPHNSSDYIFDLEKSARDEKTLTILYKSKWAVSSKVLELFAETSRVEFKGRYTEEQNRADTCGFVVGVRDKSDQIVVMKKTLAECGLNVDDMIEDWLGFTEQFLSDASLTLANVVTSLYKEAIEDAQFQNGEMTE